MASAWNCAAQKGFVLITALLFLIMLTTLCLNMLDSSLLQAKMTGNFQHNTALLNRAETALLKAELQVASRPIATPDLLPSDDNAAWLKQGRPLPMKGVQTRYALVNLQTVCYETHSTITVLDFWRITIWLLARPGDVPLLLQSTYARPGATAAAGLVCLPRTPPKTGRQSWLLLS